MRIVIDMQGWQASSRNRGIGRYTLSLVRAMLINNADCDFTLIFNGAFEDSIREFKREIKIDGFSVKIWYPITPTGFINSANNDNRTLSELTYKIFVESSHPDFFLITSIFEGLSDDVVAFLDGTESYNVGVILYDLIPLIYQDVYLSNDVLRGWYFSKLEYLKKCDYLFSISESAGAEAVTYLNWDPSFVCNISTATEGVFKPLVVPKNKKDELLSKYSINDNFLMYTGGWDYRKNIERLIESFALLSNEIKERHQLVVVCSIPEEVKGNLYSLALSKGISKSQFVLTGYVSDEELISLYNLCHAFVFPSWHEGFGLPVLEAMLCGKAVIASNVSSLPEVLNFPEAQFDPYDNKDISEKIERVLLDNDFRSRIITHSKDQVKKFSWKISSDKLINAIKESVKNKKDSIENVNSEKLKLAFFSPVPPEKSGISYYSYELIPYLSKYYDIEIINSDPEVLAFNTMLGCKIISCDEFSSKYQGYQRILYQVGNSHYHEHMLELMKVHPGVIVLHDFFLSGLKNWMCSSDESSCTFNDKLYESHGYAAVAFNNLEINNTAAVNLYPCNYPILDNGLSIIFHSEYSMKLTNTWYRGFPEGKLNHVPLLRVSPQNFEKNQARKELDLNNEDIVIVSFGYIATTKLNHKIIEAFNYCSKQFNINLKLVFVGHCSPDDNYGKQVISMISSSSTNDSIRITGWVDDETYKKWLIAADIGIQLRTMSRGETSAAVLDCMNYGLATIANANGSMAELDKSSVKIINDNFSDEELNNALREILADDNLRHKYGTSAKEYIAKKHAPEFCAERYYEIIEDAYSSFDCDLDVLSNDNLKFISTFDDSYVERYSQSLSDSFSVPMKHKIYFDLGRLNSEDVSESQKNLILQMFDDLPVCVHLEPICFNETTKKFVLSQVLTSSLISLNDMNISDELVDIFSASKVVISCPCVDYLLKVKDVYHNISVDNKLIFVFDGESFETFDDDLRCVDFKEKDIILNLIRDEVVIVISQKTKLQEQGLYSTKLIESITEVSYMTSENLLNALLDV